MNFDHCPTCDRAISDHDAKGTERPNGQRWCLIHYIEHCEALLKRAHRELTVAYWERNDDDIEQDIADVVETRCYGEVQHKVARFTATSVAACDSCRYVCAYWDDDDIDPDVPFSDNFHHQPVW